MEYSDAQTGDSITIEITGGNAGTLPHKIYGNSSITYKFSEVQNNQKVESNEIKEKDEEEVDTKKEDLENSIDKIDNVKDETIANTNLPNAGDKNINLAIVILVFSIIFFITFYKYKKLKNII